MSPFRLVTSLTRDLRIDHGLDNTMQADMSSVAYWYQTEPHEPFPALPSRRLPRFPWSNVTQWWVVAALFAALVELVVRVAASVSR